VNYAKQQNIFGENLLVLCELCKKTKYLWTKFADF